MHARPYSDGVHTMLLHIRSNIPLGFCDIEQRHDGNLYYISRVTPVNIISELQRKSSSIVHNFGINFSSSQWRDHQIISPRFNIIYKRVELLQHVPYNIWEFSLYQPKTAYHNNCPNEMARLYTNCVQSVISSII